MGQFDFLEGNAPARPAPRRRSAGRVVTIQKTSKRLKMGQLNAWSLFFIGIVVMFIGAQLSASSGGTPANPKIGAIGAIGGGCMLCGIIWIIVNRWQRWWHHG